MKVFCKNAMLAAGALVAATLIAIPAAAQNVPNTWELTLLGGGAFGGQIYQGGHTEVDVSTAATYGVRLGYNVSRAFEVEAGWNHASSNLDATPFGQMGLSGKIGTLKQDVIEASALWHFGSRRASGYVVVGLGAMLFSPDVPGVATSSTTRFTTSFGLGGKFSISPRVAVRIDGRFRGTDTGQTTGQGVWCDYYGYCYYYSSTWYSSGELTGGLLFRF
ncbi:MAG: outer membrane beta-barrel protein [Thermoanaerobaculia bacterium]